MTRSWILSVTLGLAVTAALPTSPAAAKCPNDAIIETMAQNILAATPTSPPPVSSVDDALCAQAKLVNILSNIFAASSTMSVRG